MPAPLLTNLTSFTAIAVTPFALGVASDDYVVRPGDTVSAIAAAFETTIDAVISANHLAGGGHLIYAGETLHIPAAHARGGTSTHVRPNTYAPTRSPARRHASPGPDARRIVWHTVRAGDTVTEIAVRYHAWTDELVATNHLGRSGAIAVGERLRVPVVLAALPHHQRPHDQRAHHEPPTRDLRRSAEHDDRSARSPQTHRGSHDLPNPSHAQVRAVIERTATRYGVDRQLALAVSWQEAGWQQDHISSAKAIGAMQVLPSTGRWIETIVDRPLDLRNVRHNATAGVVLLRELRQAAPLREAVAGYYQGLSSVREHGFFGDTRQYVRNVLALKHRFERGAYPY